MKSTNKILFGCFLMLFSIFLFQIVALFDNFVFLFCCSIILPLVGLYFAISGYLHKEESDSKE